MNSYEMKLDAKRQRLLERAEKHRHISEASFQRVERICSMIPLGQPILVGHHSEKHHRADINRMNNGMRKGIDEEKYANHLEARAEAVGTGGISSDDPEAVRKLKEQLEKAEKVQERMRAANKIIQAKPKNEWTFEKQTALEGLAISTIQARGLFEKDFCGRIGFADYQLTNNGANIRRLKLRIEQLTKNESREDRETAFNDGALIIRENTDANRVQLIFDKKPSAETRTICKRAGFRWSPSEGAWQRQLNNSGIWNAQNVAEQLKGKAVL